jgi:hypothetical protein
MLELTLIDSGNGTLYSQLDQVPGEERVRGIVVAFPTRSNTELDFFLSKNGLKDVFKPISTSLDLWELDLDRLKEKNPTLFEADWMSGRVTVTPSRGSRISFRCQL